MAVLGQLLLSLVVGLSIGPTLPVDTTTDDHKVAWLNAWADAHTRPGGDASYALDSTDRMRIVVDHLQHTHADLGVLAEVERTQVDAFRRYVGGSLALVTGGNDLDNAVFYRRSAFALVSRHSFWTYYRGGRKVRTPVVVLADRRTGGRVAVIPVHDPATRPATGSQSVWRSRDLAAVAREVRDLGSTPVVVAGDFNDHTGPLCALTAPAVGLASPLAGHTDCAKATDAPVDQAFVSPWLLHHDYRLYRGRDVERATDHGRFCELTISLVGGLYGIGPRVNPVSYSAP